MKIAGYLVFADADTHHVTFARGNIWLFLSPMIHHHHNRCFPWFEDILSFQKKKTCTRFRFLLETCMVVYIRDWNICVMSLCSSSVIFSAFLKNKKKPNFCLNNMCIGILIYSGNEVMLHLYTLYIRLRITQFQNLKVLQYSVWLISTDY